MRLLINLQYTRGSESYAEFKLGSIACCYLQNLSIPYVHIKYYCVFVILHIYTW